MRDVRVGGSDVLGTAAAAVLTPETLDAAATLMSEAAERRDAVAFLGGGTELGLGYPPARVDVLVKTGRLTRVVEYAPADLVVEVEAGLTLANLQKALAPHQQRLALDAPHPEIATVGGLIATNAFGPRRTRFGGIRDLIVGVSLLRADGERVRGGGKVVKNVAGFDLPKIAVGSLGTLGMIATATFRLHPLPEAARALGIEGCDAMQVRAVAREIVARQLEPAALLATRTGDAYTVYALFEGFAAGVDEQVRRFAALANDFGAIAELLDDARTPSRRDEEIRTRGDVRVRISTPPAMLADLDADVLGPVLGALDDARAVVYPALGAAFVSGYLGDVDAAVTALERARRAGEALGGNMVVLDARSSALRERVDVFGTLPGAFPLMRRLKDRFDPAHRLNPGRFLGGL